VYLLAVGLLLTITADAVAGPLFLPAKIRKIGSPGKSWRLPWTLIGRAMGLRLLLPYLAVTPVLAALFLLATDRVDAARASRAVRLGGAMMLVLFIAILAGMLSVRRPPWPWSRSLPWSAGQKIISDTLFIILAALPLIAVVGLLDSGAALTLLASCPTLAAFSAGAMRRSCAGRSGPWGKILLNGGLAAAALTILPLFAVLFLLLTPLLLLQAASSEKKRKVTAWNELHHRAAGDPFSWSA
jgi:hypothetical protein